MQLNFVVEPLITTTYLGKMLSSAAAETNSRDSKN